MAGVKYMLISLEIILLYDLTISLKHKRYWTTREVAMDALFRPNKACLTQAQVGKSPQNGANIGTTVANM